ncbi:MAG: hypothetical protein KME43_21330 [Myxacorys chilensis ATA2-1-KO14]|jgi:hypothetical protein|nr:hypothetical protein [Myxacorys chilensis ATA2-1-KO14]
MKFQIIAAAALSALCSLVLSASVAKAETHQQCLDNAAATRQENIKIVGRAAADIIWNADVDACNAGSGK